jgi:nicotinate-nucleotide pyrophosphorylase (carboxylating)
VPTEFASVEWNNEVREAARHLVRLAIAEDFGDQCDWTSTALVSPSARGAAKLVSRQPGVVAGMPLIDLVLDELNAEVELLHPLADGSPVERGTRLGTLSGKTLQILMAERISLNFLGRLSGIATLTHEYVRSIDGTGARIYDTRKTTPGWRLLEKYAVHCGGGYNHRLGLHRAVMLKDNHVAAAKEEGLDLAGALEKVRTHLTASRANIEAVEVEVDSLDQLEALLPSRPDIILLDNMPAATLRAAVALRDRLAPEVVLEASGGITLTTARALAEAGVDRLSVGALTHSAVALDIGLDWAR